MSNVEKLKDELDKMYDSGMKNFHVSWGPEAHKLNKEEMAKAVLDMIEETKKWNALSTEEKMRRQIKEVYEDLEEAIKLTQTDFKEPFEMSEDRKKLSELFCILDMSLLTLGNWVSNEDRIKIRNKLKEDK